MVMCANKDTTGNQGLRSLRFRTPACEEVAVGHQPGPQTY